MKSNEKHCETFKKTDRNEPSVPLRLRATLVVISCGNRKKKVPCRAEEMYSGPYFSALLSAARRIGPRILILSAKYGLIELDQVIAPYSIRMGDEGSVGFEVLRSQAVVLPKFDRVIVLAGRRYLKVCQVLWPTCESPLDGIGGIGKQLKRLKQF